VRSGEIPTVLLHLVGTEELRPQGRFRKRGLKREAARSQRCRHASDTIEEAGTIQVQWGTLPAPGVDFAVVQSRGQRQPRSVQGVTNLYENHTPFVYSMVGRGAERAAADVSSGTEKERPAMPAFPLTTTL